MTDNTFNLDELQELKQAYQLIEFIEVESIVCHRINGLIVRH